MMSRWLMALSLVLALFALLPGEQALAQQAPAANDALLLQQLKGDVTGRVSIPDAKSGLLIQPEGREWRELREGPVKTVGAILILGMVALIVVFYAMRGQIKISSGPSQRRITRFSGFERFTHWLTAVSFIVLALTGLNLIYGRYVLLPVIGPEAFTTISLAGKWAHNFTSIAFVLGLVIMLVTWIAHNMPSALDVEWFARGGGLIGKSHPPARKFNAGQKVIYWLVILGGAALTVTGVYLLMPFQFTGMAGQQLALVIHAAVALVMVAAIIGHIYIGSIGMEGAFDAMGTGEVDLNWARDHHSLWVDEMTSRPGRASAGD